MRLYQYVGPRQIAARVGPEPAGVPINSLEDVAAWVRAAGRGPVIVTYVIDAGGRLLVADRRSEHVACAGGRPVRAAGELTFAAGGRPEVVAVSNQSTGYCPDLDSWPAVAEALGRVGLAAPAGFDPACVLRRCPGCDGINVVKDGVFECAICGAALPATYNVQE